MSIKFRQIEHALAVWRKGSFRGAAAEEHLSQPALSRSVQALEESLGVSLFDRRGNEVTLTSYGEVFLARAEKILMDAAELEREMTLMKGLGSGRFSVAMGVYPAGMSGSRALAELLRIHPRLRIRVTMPTGFEVARMVRHRQVDVGIAEISHLRDVPEFCVESLGQHEVVFYSRVGHPVLARPGALSEEILDEYPFAGVPVPARLAHLFPGNLSIDESTGDIFPPILVEDLTTACGIVASTDAFGAAIPLQLEPWLKMGALAVVPFRAPWLRLDYGFIRLAGRSLPPAAEAFMAIVRDVEREQAMRNQTLTDELFRRLGLGA